MATYILELSIPWVPKSLNASIDRGWHRNRKDGKAWDAFIWSETRGKLPEKPLELASISITRHSHRMLDYDGLVGSMKPVVDALVSAGVLKDDSWSVLGRWNVDQSFRRKKEAQLLVISVKEIVV